MYEKIANRLNEIYVFEPELAVTSDEVEAYLRLNIEGDLTEYLIEDINDLLDEYID